MSKAVAVESSGDEALVLFDGRARTHAATDHHERAPMEAEVAGCLDQTACRLEVA